MEDICIVCAEPLAYAAYAACGHKDACSKCVARLRSVLKDPRCVYCQVGAAAVPYAAGPIFRALCAKKLGPAAPQRGLRGPRGPSAAQGGGGGIPGPPAEGLLPLPSFPATPVGLAPPPPSRAAAAAAASPAGARGLCVCHPLHGGVHRNRTARRVCRAAGERCASAASGTAGRRRPLRHSIEPVLSMRAVSLPLAGRCALCPDRHWALCQQRPPRPFSLSSSSPAAQGRAKRGELQHLASAQAYFDDAAHFREIAGLCSYTHPRALQEGEGEGHMAEEGPGPGSAGCMVCVMAHARRLTCLLPSPLPGCPQARRPSPSPPSRPSRPTCSSSTASSSATSAWRGARCGAGLYLRPAAGKGPGVIAAASDDPPAWPLPSPYRTCSPQPRCSRLPCHCTHARVHTHTHHHHHHHHPTRPQVFVAEQQVYGKAELERHMRGGDVEGPMAAAGFKGHPECRRADGLGWVGLGGAPVLPARPVCSCACMPGSSHRPACPAPPAASAGPPAGATGRTRARHCRAAVCLRYRAGSAASGSTERMSCTSTCMPTTRTASCAGGRGGGGGFGKEVGGQAAGTSLLPSAKQPHVWTSLHLPSVCCAPPAAHSSPPLPGVSTDASRRLMPLFRCLHPCRRANPHKFVYYRDYADLESEWGE